MNLVIVGASNAERMESAVSAFEAVGFERIGDLDGLRDADFVLGVSDGGAELLREADRRQIKYVLVHDGDSDGHAGGTYERAHHRIEAGQREELARHLLSRTRPLVTCLAFGYKNGAPSEAALLIDARFLDNPYWVPELREKSGRDPEVADYVLKQPAARRLLDDIERIVGELLPLYQEKGRMHVVVAFGCTGGQHRSVVLASELARRLDEKDGIDVDFVTRDVD
ncbi:MAG TPA: RNase adapter RapZ [Candidatus Dormibacteraeota bacterium]|nr:RNase adapter RapZ [Candidatus Dormibacteraeota bacterium]